MKVFFDTEFTGLHQGTTLISIGCVAEDGRTFYAELDDYNRDQVDSWIRQNVLDNLALIGQHDFSGTTLDVAVRGNRLFVSGALGVWLQSLDGQVEMWLDCLAYDWVLFCQLFGGALGIPKFVYYIPFDLATLLKLKDIDPDINREAFAEIAGGGVPKHNALWDARIIEMCYKKAMAV